MSTPHPQAPITPASSALKKIAVGGRGTVFCPVCQAE
ncbi:MAG: hypothetical protein IKY00_07015 [Clostridia bacterium]|nr:hypothetical protein [Clostridia bacterium]